MKQFVKTFSKEGAGFKYIQEKFPYTSAEKIKEGVFVGPQIKKFTENAQCPSTMTDEEKKHGFTLQKLYQNFSATLQIQITKPLLKTCWLVLSDVSERKW